MKSPGISSDICSHRKQDQSDIGRYFPLSTTLNKDLLFNTVFMTSFALWCGRELPSTFSLSNTSSMFNGRPALRIADVARSLIEPCPDEVSARLAVVSRPSSEESRSSAAVP